MAAIKQKQASPNKKIGLIVRNCLVTLFVAAFVAVLLSVLPIQGTYKLYTVSSGSMEPKIKTGSLVVVKPAATYIIGDVITFSDSADSKNTTTHRIVGINGTSFVTKGDANDSADVNSVQATNVVGKVLFHIPYIGYPVGYAKTLPGLIILIVIPSTIIIWEEMKKLKKEWGKTKLEEKKQEQANPPSTKGSKKIAVQKKAALVKKLDSAHIIKTIFILIATACVATLSINAFYNDNEIGSGTLTSGTWQSNCLVINEVYYHVDAAHGLDGEDVNGKKTCGPQNNNPDEWVELYNSCNALINVKNWTITDNEKTLTIHANKSVPAHGYGLVAKSASTWTQYWGFNHLGNLDGIEIIETGESGPPTNQVLDNAGDRIILKDATDKIIDQMNYGNDTSVWNPAVPAVIKGHSLGRNPFGYDSDQPSDFKDNCRPSPGTPTVTTCPEN